MSVDISQDYSTFFLATNCLTFPVLLLNTYHKSDYLTLITNYIVTKLNDDSLGCHLLWWHWLVFQAWLQFFKKLLNDSGLHEMVLSPFRYVVHHQWQWNIQTKPPDLRTINVVYETGSPNGRSGNVIITPQIRICKIIMCWYKCICSLSLPPDVRLMYIIRKIKALKM